MAKIKKGFRLEKDSLGEVYVPKNALYGAQTQRAVENFEIGWAMDLNLIFPYIIIKKAAAISNHAQKRFFIWTLIYQRVYLVDNGVTYCENGFEKLKGMICPLRAGHGGRGRGKL